jgi:hypothetical protein
VVARRAVKSFRRHLPALAMPRSQTTFWPHPAGYEARGSNKSSEQEGRAYGLFGARFRCGRFVFARRGRGVHSKGRYLSTSFHLENGSASSGAAFRRARLQKSRSLTRAVSVLLPYAISAYLGDGHPYAYLYLASAFRQADAINSIWRSRSDERIRIIPRAASAADQVVDHHDLKPE